MFVWTKYDSFLYAIHNSGYYRWSVENKFKTRFEMNFDKLFRVKAGVLDSYRDTLILYGDNHLFELTEKVETENSFNKKDLITISRKIKQIIFQNGFYFVNILLKMENNQ